MWLKLVKSGRYSLKIFYGKSMIKIGQITWLDTEKKVNYLDTVNEAAFTEKNERT